MPNFSPVECYEERGTVSEDASIEGHTASVTLRTPFAKRYDLVTDLLLYGRPWPYAPVPAYAPFAQTCAIKPALGKQTQAGQGSLYQDALVTVNYGQKAHEVDNAGQKIYSEEIEPTVEFQTLDHKQFRWGTAGGDMLLPAEAPGRLIRGFNYVKTFFAVRNPPAVPLLALMGHVNNAQIASELLPFVFEPETLLYAPPHMSRSFSIGGNVAWTVKVKFTFKAEGWNKFWRAESGAYEDLIVYKTDTVYKNYPLGNFGPLIAMGI